MSTTNKQAEGVQPQAEAEVAVVSQPRRIQLSRKKGWRMPENTIVVSRPRHWGNPYRVGPEQGADECVKKFEAFMLRRPSWVLAAQQQLRGKNLACWCALDAPCHADVLLRLANDQADRRPDANGRTEDQR